MPVRGRLDAEEYDAFFRACSGRLVGQLYLLTGDREEARDCVQEALERAWLRWRSVSALDDPEGWVRSVARNLAVSRWRRSRNALAAWRRNPQVELADPADGGERDALVEGLRQLPVAQRTALVLHYLCDLDVQAVAAETGVSPSTVTSRLARGRAALHFQMSTTATASDGGRSA